MGIYAYLFVLGTSNLTLYLCRYFYKFVICIMWNTHHVVPDHIKDIARSLRYKSTNAEKILRESLRNRKLQNIKRYRQFPLCIWYDGKYKWFIADFYSHQLSLVIELDGWYHDNIAQKEYDQDRTYMINWVELQVIRFKNKEVENSLDEVLRKIWDFIF